MSREKLILTVGVGIVLTVVLITWGAGVLLQGFQREIEGDEK